MFKRNIFIIVFICFSLLSCHIAEQKSDIHWITIQDLISSLEGQPAMNVGFDIDDTVLFSSPGYYYGMQKYSPGENSFLRIDEFWEEMNNGLDRFSIPKECAKALIEMHRKRGDSVYFITARTPTKTETVTDLLALVFSLEDPKEVIFTGSKRGENLKIKSLKEHNIQIFYGDSDGDIQAALAVGIRPIRIMRAGNSTHKPLPKNGSLEEEVLVDSEF